MTKNKIQFEIIDIKSLLAMFNPKRQEISPSRNEFTLTCIRKGTYYFKNEQERVLRLSFGCLPKLKKGDKVSMDINLGIPVKQNNNI